MSLPLNTIIQGDCLEVMRGMEDGCVDLVLTDPPYGIDIQKTGCYQTGVKGFTKAGKFQTPRSAVIEGDKKPLGAWLKEAYRLLKPNTACYFFSRWDVDFLWYPMAVGAGFKMKNQIIWAKHTGGSGDLQGAFTPSHETLWRAGKGRPLIRGKRIKDVWFDNWTECVRHGKLHPFEKPIDILEKCVYHDTDEGAVVLDCYAGSGTTAAACIRQGRNYIGIEISEEYCKIARKRVQEAKDSMGLFNKTE